MYETGLRVTKCLCLVGAKLNVPQEQHIEDVRNVLFKLPKIHLYVLDAVIKHLKKLVLTSFIAFGCWLTLCRLVDSTKTDEVRNLW